MDILKVPSLSYALDREKKIKLLLDTLADKDTSKVLTPDEKLKFLMALDSNLADACSFAKEKIFITNNCYDYVDKQIRRLDADLEKFDVALSKYKISKGSEQTQLLNSIYEEADVKKLYLFPISSRLKPSEIKSEFPVDPNEPTYCFCKQVAYGEMIACDNEECDIKWFHFECVDVKSLPKGTWYCPECEPIMGSASSTTNVSPRKPKK